MYAMYETNGILQLMDATNAIPQVLHATNVIPHAISHHVSIDTSHQYSTSTTSPARGSLPIVSNGAAEKIMWPWLLAREWRRQSGRRNPGEGGVSNEFYRI